MKAFLLVVTLIAWFPVQVVLCQQQQQEQQRLTDEQRRRYQQYQERLRAERQHKKQQQQGGFTENESYGEEANFTEFKGKIQDSFCFLFPTSKPSGLVEGVFNALKSILLGFSISTASFFGIPFISFQKMGPKGAIIGGIMGSILSTIVSIASIGNAIFQLASGLIGVPSTLWALASGSFWDATRREWIRDYNLEEEEKKLSSPNHSSGTTVRNTDLYDLLNVAPGATAKEIKSAYFTQAKLLHPDKNPDNEQANEDFLRLHQAYSTLSDDKLRADYDKFGTATENALSTFNVKVFFAILLDAETVEPFVGNLQVSYYIEKLLEVVQISKSGGSMDSFTDMLDFGHDSRRRQVDIAQHILSIIRDFVDESLSEDAFTEKCQSLADIIASSSFGKTFLSMIGKNLALEANAYLGYSSPLRLPVGLYTSMNQQVQSWKEKWRVVRKTYKVGVAFVSTTSDASDATTMDEVSAQKRAKDRTERKKSNLGMSSETIQDLLPGILEMAWTFIARDIAFTLTGSCQRLFHDAVESHTLYRRARGVRILARAMLQASGDATCGTETPDELNERLETAFKLAMMQAN